MPLKFQVIYIGTGMVFGIDVILITWFEAVVYIYLLLNVLQVRAFSLSMSNPFIFQYSNTYTFESLVICDLAINIYSLLNRLQK